MEYHTYYKDIHVNLELFRSEEVLPNICRNKHSNFHSTALSLIQILNRHACILLYLLILNACGVILWLAHSIR